MLQHHPAAQSTWDCPPLHMAFRNPEPPIITFRATRTDVQPPQVHIIPIELTDDDLWYLDEAGEQCSTPLADIVQNAASRAVSTIRAAERAVAV